MVTAGGTGSALSLRQTVKQDIYIFLAEFVALDSSITFSSFKAMWCRRNASALHKFCPKRASRSMWFNLLASCALELLFQAPAVNLLTSVRAVAKRNDQLSDICSIVLESVWNIGVVYFLYCLHKTRDMSVDVEVKIRISFSHFREIELSLARWSLMGCIGDQGARCWMRLLQQEAVMLACYTGNETIVNGQHGAMRFPYDVEAGATQRESFDQIAAKNDRLTAFAAADRTTSDQGSVTIMNILEKNYNIRWELAEPSSLPESVTSLLVLPNVPAAMEKEPYLRLSLAAVSDSSSTSSGSRSARLFVIGAGEVDYCEHWGARDQIDVCSRDERTTISSSKMIRHSLKPSVPSERRPKPTLKGSDARITSYAPPSEEDFSIKSTLLWELESQVAGLEERQGSPAGVRSRRSETTTKAASRIASTSAEREKTGTGRAKRTKTITSTAQNPKRIRRAVMAVPAGGDSDIATTDLPRASWTLLEELEKTVAQVNRDEQTHGQ